jgi:hypothetical protein
MRGKGLRYITSHPLLIIPFHSLFDICPATDPTLIGLTLLYQFGTAAGMPWPNCNAYLQPAQTCVNSLGFIAPSVTGTLFNPTNTPAAGTQTLSNIAGEMTTPASGAVFTWTGGDGVPYPITAISAAGIVVTGTGAGSAEGTATGIGTGTAAAGSGASDVHQGVGIKTRPAVSILAGSVLVSAVRLFLL